MFCGGFDSIGGIAGCTSVEPSVSILHWPIVFLVGLSYIIGPTTIATIAVWLLRKKFKKYVWDFLFPASGSSISRILHWGFCIICIAMTLLFLIRLFDMLFQRFVLKI